MNNYISKHFEGINFRDLCKYNLNNLYFCVFHIRDFKMKRGNY